MSHTEKIIKYIKAFNGDVIGGYVRDKFSNNTDSPTRDLDCRIDKNMVRFFINVLMIDYEVKENIVSSNYRKLDVVSYTIVYKSFDSTQLKLDILCCDINKWIEYPVDFDVNTLAENNDSCYVRPHYYYSSPCINSRLNVFIDRCQKLKFGLLNVPEGNFADVMTLLIRSKVLVERGWKMDDTYIGKNSWVINKWKTLTKETSNVRTQFSDRMCSTLISQEQCCLCHETFDENDVVFNSCCNHNFHWSCHQMTDENSSTNGISHWFTVKNSYKCPFCRQDAVCVTYNQSLLRNLIPLALSPVISSQSFQPILQL